ncbi:hypothetical protein [Paractinoplanes ferrugineus]|uniref:Secreted protein n=1 Tax=Paractinoplanes ferrugineus TaxID=113564 RepID=A0A919MPL1_9ACTN|nr:hypothetical protein [Actinoplanes ferrugineus]GIE15422.1 hypothetical protein Afe05nite_72620 [Actinoplanes ferrugineus]
MLAVVAATVVAVTGVNVAPAFATTETGFGPFNSSGDCGTSVYIDAYKIKYWACSWNISSTVITGIAIRNYGSGTQTVTANWQRWYNYMSSQAHLDSQQTYFSGVTIDPGETFTIYNNTGQNGPASLCSDNSGCYAKGAKGYVDVKGTKGTVVAHGASAYSPLQSIEDWCLEGPEITNWPDLDRCEDR